MKGKTIAALALAGIATAGLSLTAYAFHGGHRGFRHGGGGGEFAMRAVMQPEQKQQMKQIFANERPTLKTLHQQMRAAREALTDKLYSSDSQPDISKEVAQLKAAQAAMIDERVKISLAARGVLSTDQLQKANKLRTDLENLHKQERELMRQAFSGGTTAVE